MDWDKLKVFHRLQRREALPTPASSSGFAIAVSRQVSALEQELRSVAFHRHARGSDPTEQATCCSHCTMTCSAVAGGARQAHDSQTADATATERGDSGITPWQIDPAARRFTHYPASAISLVVTDEDLDLSMREADVAIRTAARPSRT